MKYIYMSLTITEYHLFHEPSCTCRLYTNVDDGELEVRELEPAEAKKLMWELVLAGATRSTYVNPYRPSLYTTDVTYFARH